ncbi:MAG: T9SS type A sorting domain-containing protein [Bacteroidia bacterium]
MHLVIYTSTIKIMTKINKILLSLLFVWYSNGLLNAQTQVPSIISSNQVWTAAGSPYVISANTLLHNGYTIRVMPGTTIESNGTSRLIVNGEFIAEGTVDSVITIDKLNFQFTDISKGYDFDSSTGSHFNYCFFKGVSTGGNKTIDIDKISLLITNCRFLNHYYAIYGVNGYQDSVKIKILKTIFESSPNSQSYGYVMYINGNKSMVEMDECSIINQYGMSLGNFTKVTRCLFQNYGSYSGIRVNLYASSSIVFHCNTFRNFKTSVFDILGSSSSANVDISNNTFDSADNFITISYSNSMVSRPSIKNNNFLYCKNYAVRFYASSTSGLSDTFSFTNNYWGTVDTAIIKSKIYDFNDNITVVGVADYSSFLSSPIYTCTEDQVSVNKLSSTEFNLYPNPSNGYTILKFKDDAVKTVTLFDMKGIVVYEESSNGFEHYINLKDLNSGVYVVEVKEVGKLASYHKLLLEN